MTIEKMRGEIALAYPGMAWAARVSRMSDEQVIAVYHRLSTTGKLEEAYEERRRNRSPEFRQLSIFDKEYSAV